MIGMVIAAPRLCAVSELPPDHADAGVRAQVLLGKAASLQAQAREDLSRTAIAHYRQAARLYRLAGDAAGEARALTLAAGAMLGISYFPAAIATFEKAIRLTGSAQHIEVQFAAIDGLAHAYFELGEPAALSRLARRARDLSERIGKPLPRARAFIASARAHFLLSNDPAAFADFRQALAICRAENQPPCEAEALEGIAWTYSDTGDLQAAIANQESAMLLWQGLGDARAATRAERMIATFYSWLGDREKALPAHHKTLRQFQRFGDRLWEGRARLDLAWEYLELDAALSSAYQLRALHIFQAIGHRADQLSALADLCWNFRSTGQLNKALHACRERYRLASSLGDPRREAVAASEIGLILQEMGDLRHAMKQYDLALQLSRKAADPRGQGDTLRYMGGIHLLQGQPKHALAVLCLAAQMSNTGDDRAGEAAAWKDVGRAHAVLGELGPARRALENAVTLAESLRERAGSPMMRAAYFASVQSYYESYIELLMQSHSQAPHDGFDVLAFEASERSRARSLLEFVGSSGTSERTQDATRNERLRALQTELETKLRKLAALPAGDIRRSTLETDLRQIQADIDELGAASRQRPHGQSDTTPRVARLR
ncbi:MAG: hypothetical protein L0Z53_22995, partial [Acidobacteriales bacterium]|nr:hypothetical protein [Terriglobales bacterium]